MGQYLHNILTDLEKSKIKNSCKGQGYVASKRIGLNKKRKEKMLLK